VRWQVSLALGLICTCSGAMGSASALAESIIEPASQSPALSLATSLPLKPRIVPAAPEALGLQIAALAADETRVSLKLQGVGPGMRLRLEQNGQILQELEASEQPLQLKLLSGQNIHLQLHELDEQGQLLRSSQPLTVNTSDLQPRQFLWSLASHRVFDSTTSPILLQAPDLPGAQGQLSVERNGQVVHRSQVRPGQQVLIPPLPLTPGRHELRFRVRNAWGEYLSPSQPVFYLGVTPPDHTFALIDKYQFSLYWVQNGVLQKIYPIATGRPRTPTVPGLWLMGHKEVMSPPTTDWGARRLKIYRENQYRGHWSGYAIHGTNRPNSIGTEASHGCVRMFNADVSELFEQMPLGTPILIEERLKVDVNEVGAAAREE